MYGCGDTLVVTMALKLCESQIIHYLYKMGIQNLTDHVVVFALITNKVFEYSKV